MDSTVWHFLLAYWLVIFWGIIIFAVAVVGITIAIDKLIDEIQFQIERRRYQRAKK